ncbi:MAG: hypothetical protein ACR2NW_06475, partial [Thermodesulfobacteriota bacterium]
MREGKGVDYIVNLIDEFEVVFEKLDKKTFQTIICNSMLEHCENPFKACDNLDKLLIDEGVIFVSVPFSWRIHGYPSDYWRFTPEAIKVLFPNISFFNKRSNM